MDETPTISEFFTNKNVFITGGTGFIGKVLVEKLLRSCPNLESIYLLLREKKGQSIEQRVKAVTELPLFDLLRSQNPEALKKLKPVLGDVGKLELGLNPDDRKLLTENVNVVFHGAASVRFDDSVKDAIRLNTRGTRETANLALYMKNLEVFVHISTTYAHCNRKVVEEKMYESHTDWKKAIKIAEETDRHVLNALTDKFIYPMPNTYTFAKSLGEHVVYDVLGKTVPLVIYRPSVVSYTAFEPMPGWVDNFNGPMGLSAGCLTGLLRTVYADKKTNTDFICVDIIVKTMITAAWRQITQRDITQKLTPAIYNGSNNNVRPLKLGKMIKDGVEKSLKTYPCNTMLWYPNPVMTKCFYYYFIRVIFFHIFPAIILDAFLKIIGKKPMLLKLHRRIYNATIALAYFTHNEWTFINKKMLNLPKEAHPEDRDNYSLRDDEVTFDYIFNVGNLGIKKYLLREKDDFKNSKQKLFIFWILYQVVNVLWYLGLFWIIFFKLNAVSAITNVANEICCYFIN